MFFCIVACKPGHSSWSEATAVQCSAVQCRSLCSPARPCSVHVREVMRAVKPSGFYQLPQIKPAQLLVSKVYCRNCQKNKTIMAERQAQLTMGFPVSLLHGDLKSLYCFGRILCAGSSLQRHMLTCVTWLDLHPCRTAWGECCYSGCTVQSQALL